MTTSSAAKKPWYLRDEGRGHYVCITCGDYVRKRVRHLYDETRQGYRCKSCWDKEESGDNNK